VSLIFEALKKLEREKRAPDRGFTVVAQQTWPERRAARLPIVAGGLALLVVGLALGAWLTAPSPAGTSVPAAPTRAVAPKASPPATSVSEPAAPEPVVAEARRPAPPTTLRSPERPPAVEPPPAPPAAKPQPAAMVPPEPEVEAQPARGAVSPAPVLTLEAISERDGTPVAIISGRLVQEGDTVGDARVLRIGADRVELEVAGEPVTLTF
jgi:outer membrane biosynthesis protein TonB